ncbi:unnamed protein product [Didymodactylos carnosus]|uniref:Methyltransferase type 11 domain-containing protein n=2 Tax=Didymodactylos carnosus TaxID=1234261 RepID=A0A815ITT3_9BILA|nr:unnamed protein product [Didymodactylos carnosus]CAF4255859.1 unnamed protein product [Didymodactylos carnosus]
MHRLLKTLSGMLFIIVALIAIALGYLKTNSNIRNRVFASLCNSLANPNDTKMMNLRCDEILDKSRINGNVLEIGAGTGINLHCLHNNTNIKSWIAIEPNPYMKHYIDGYISKLNIKFQTKVLHISATKMVDIQSDSIDTVIMTHVLCSIPDPLPREVLLEAHRVLKPGGKFYIMEHTIADRHVKPNMNTFQLLIGPLWKIIGDGCEFKPIANYLDDMKHVYKSVTYQKFQAPIKLVIARDHIKGVLIK